MAGTDEKPKLVEWNLRGFPEDLRAACQKIALDERSEKGKRPKDADVVARLIRQALGIPQPPETAMLNSENENGKEPVRRSSPATDPKGPAKNRRNKQA
jgi:hypothetical protein